MIDLTKLFESFDGSRIDRLEQYAGPWLVDPEYASFFEHRVSTIDWPAHVAARRAQGRDPLADAAATIDDDGIATLRIEGMLTRYGSSLSDFPGTVALRSALRDVVNADGVNGIMLVVNSPGGSADGVDELAEDIATAAGRKPMVAFVEGMAASGGYWLASQAPIVVSQRGAQIGSIGAYLALTDMSAAAAQEGVKVHVIRSGKAKGIGVRGSEVTADQISILQDRINDLHNEFVTRVAEGRGVAVEKIEAVADGNVMRANDALAAGLVDIVGNIDVARERLLVAMGKQTKRQTSRAGERAADHKPKEIAVSDTVTTGGPQAATIAELKSAFADAGNDFYVDCMSRELTIEQAQSAYTDVLRKRVADAEAAKAEAEEKAEEALAAKANVAPEPLGSVKATGEVVTDPMSAYEEGVAAVQRSNPDWPRYRCVHKFNKDPKNAAIVNAYVAAYNEEKKPARIEMRNANAKSFRAVTRL